MNKALELFLADEKNKRTVTILESLLDGVSVIQIASKQDVTRDAVYKVKEKYIK
ncbi:helix-turn-helix domain-containing protein [Colwellia sp. 75C3]|uniref:helix-turn-helix domain-containing protein n=1 Tax=Colwellia sp. 75C3 TaxID=888425 RepID=UPI0012FEE00F|nr:helix-turn-helix domain-containing protein [Colwellia sp. 75C3]